MMSSTMSPVSPSKRTFSLSTFLSLNDGDQDNQETEAFSHLYCGEVNTITTDNNHNKTTTNCTNNNMKDTVQQSGGGGSSCSCCELSSCIGTNTSESPNKERCRRRQRQQRRLRPATVTSKIDLINAAAAARNSACNTQDFDNLSTTCINPTEIHNTNFANTYAKSNNNSNAMMTTMKKITPSLSSPTTSASATRKSKSTTSTSMSRNVNSIPNISCTCVYLNCVYLNEIPNEILSLIESYIPPSSIVSLTLTCTKYYKRWTSRRWQKTFRLHYGIVVPQQQQQQQQQQLHQYSLKKSFSSSSAASLSSASISSLSYYKNKYEMYYKTRYGTWENSFVSDDFDENNNGNGNDNDHEREEEEKWGGGDGDANTKFNRNSLLPSLKHSYKCLWYKIELSMLGLDLTCLGDDVEDESNDNDNNNIQPQQEQQLYERTALRVVTKIIQMLFLPLVEYFLLVIFSKSDFVGWRRRRRQVLQQQQQQEQRQERQQRRRREQHRTSGPHRAIYSSSSYSSLNISSDSDDDENDGHDDHDDKNDEKQRTGANTSTNRMKAVSYYQSLNIQNKDIDTINAWKLACLLKEKGVNCIRCRLCDEIDVVGSSKSEIMTWMTPCRCPEPVHRKCLEEKLGLVQSLYSWEVLKFAIQNLFSSSSSSNKSTGSSSSDGDGMRCSHNRMYYHQHHQQQQQIMHRESIAPQIWVSYDSPPENNNDNGNNNDNVSTVTNSPVNVDELNQFTSPIAKCCKCGVTYSRALRLPRSIPEVIFSSMSDNLAVLRALSTAAHFLICILYISSMEGKCENDKSCGESITIYQIGGSVLKWPLNSWKGLALAWWQLQQCVMLHIFFSARFVAIVDRLWMHSGSVFYVKLYVYFVLTSLVLAVSFLPFVTRKVKRTVLSLFMNEATMDLLSPVWDIISFCNLCQFAISSTTVIMIFWRTNYRMYTVADRKKLNNNISSTVPNQHQVFDLNISADGAGFDHPIYHGRWQ